MNKYELAVAINGQAEDDARKAALDKVRGLITRFKGTITSEDDWGKRRFAYEVNKVKEGYYVFISFVAPQAFPAELDRVFKITDGILRSLIVNVDE